MWQWSTDVNSLNRIDTALNAPALATATKGTVCKRDHTKRKTVVRLSHTQKNERARDACPLLRTFRSAERTPGESDLAVSTMRPRPTAVTQDTTDAVAYDSTQSTSVTESPASRAAHDGWEHVLKIVALSCSLLAFRFA